MPESVTDIWLQEQLHLQPSGEAPKLIGSGFYRGESCNFNPYHADHAAKDLAERFLVRGWAPSERFVTSRSRVTTFGSCFAQHINAHLKGLGFRTSTDRDPGIYISLVREGLVNVHSLLQQLEWALEGLTPPSDLWHGFDAASFGYDPDIQRRTREVLLGTDVFILTFGLSEVWYDAATGGVFWRAIPLRHYDASRHRFRVLTMAESKAAIARILALIGTHVPNAKVVMTVSPIPLAATFRPVSCLTANAVSKSILRAALDEALREHAGGVETYYFPAFEAVNELFPQPFLEDGRHCQEGVVPSIMRLFEALYCDTALTLEEAEAGLRQARLDAVRALVHHPLYAAAFADQDTALAAV